MKAAFVDVLKVVTAFMLAHSLTLTLASLQVLALPSQGALLLSPCRFNLGVELGQLALVGGFLPAAFLLRRTRYYRGLLTGSSALIVLIAAAWFVERAFELPLF